MSLQVESVQLHDVSRKGSNLPHDERTLDPEGGHGVGAVSHTSVGGKSVDGESEGPGDLVGDRRQHGAGKLVPGPAGLHLGVEVQAPLAPGR